ncbi:MAG: hypothetical protein ACO3GO_07615 [Terrimicrobiaceae bacterium]
MGGQACVFYGAAQFSKDIDFLILAERENFDGLHRALEDLQARRIAVPPFSPEVLARGHAVHFRCSVAGVEGLRVDVMVKLRDFDGFHELWERRTTISEEQGGQIHLLSIPDLVKAKKTQRSRDWPVIEALVEAHYEAMHENSNRECLEFWFLESRSPDRLVDLCARYPEEAAVFAVRRPLLALASRGDFSELGKELDSEKRLEQEKDRIYWEPLKREMEEFRRAEREAAWDGGAA